MPDTFFFSKLVASLTRERVGAEHARDLALGLGELRAQAEAGPEVYDRMTRMAERFGLAPADLSRHRWAQLDAARTCARCGDARACARWLNGGRSAFSPVTCPNAPLYAELAEELSEDAES